MLAVPVVVVEPAGQVCGAHLGAGVGEGVGPLAQRRLDEALGLAVGAGPVRAGESLSDTQFPAGGGELLGAIARAIVAEHATDGDAETPVVGHGRAQMGDG